MRYALIALLLLTLPYSNVLSAATPANYAVVVSQATRQQADWSRVVDALVDKHAAEVLVYDRDVTESVAALRKLHPRYTCFVATSAEATRQFVADVHVLTRTFDDDPYTDTFWGILTGYDAAGALRIAKHREPLVVRRVGSGTDVALEMCEEGVWYDELVKNRTVRKKSGGQPIQSHGPDDTTAALVDLLNNDRADLFVASGHATERNWMIGFRYPNGRFVSGAGQMWGLDTSGRRIEIDAPRPKVYLPIGNCLMGHIDGPDAMALAWMNDAGVYQMIGYTVPTWYGYMGWGCLDYFVEQPGRYTMAEAFHANQHALIHRLATYFPELTSATVKPGERTATASLSPEAKTAGLSPFDGAGLLHDRDVVAFYGDPKWSATMARLPTAWDQTLTEQDGLYTLTIKPNRGEQTFQPINTNGSQRGNRPIIHFFPKRLTNIRLIEANGLDPIIADDFLLIPNPQECDPNRRYVVRFKANEVDVEPTASVR